MAEKRKPTKKKKMTKQEQAERFKQTARDIEADQSGEAFEKAFRKLVPVKRPNKTGDA